MKSVGRIVATVVALACSVLAACAPPEKSPSRSESAVAVEPIAAAPVLPSQATPAAARSMPAPPARRRVVINDIDLTDVGYDRGKSDAPIVVINFSDFGCPYCGQFERETYPALHREFVETGNVYFKYVPFVMGMFPNGAEAARAAECAADAGAFWPMHDRLYGSQSEWKRSSSPAELFLRYATGSTDTARVAACYRAQEVHPRTARANAVAERLGVRVTPSFVVNGRPIEGALPLPEFRKVLRELLK